MSPLPESDARLDAETLRIQHLSRRVSEIVDVMIDRAAYERWSARNDVRTLAYLSALEHERCATDLMSSWDLGPAE